MRTLKETTKGDYRGSDPPKLTKLVTEAKYESRLPTYYQAEAYMGKKEV